MHTVSEEQIKRAMRLLYETSGLIVEPSGAVGLAAIMKERERFAQKSVALVLSGANLTPSQLSEWVLHT